MTSANKDITTIRITKETRDELVKFFGSFDDTYEDIIKRLMKGAKSEID